MADAALEADLRLTVHRFRSVERRRVFPPAVHVGDLAGDEISWPVSDDLRLDDGLRTDVALELLERAVGDVPPAVWLTRMGVPEPHDVDAAWHGPLARALGSAGVTPRCLVVITKRGWYDPASGERVVWQRLRIRSRGP